MKYILSILLCTFCLSASAQILDYKEYYLGAGYTAGFSKFEQINSILNRYDDAVNQEKEFRDILIPNGISFVAGTTQSIFNFEIGFNQLQQRRKTLYNDGSDLFRREVRLTLNSFHVGTGLFMPAGNSFGIGSNVSFDYFRAKLGTREGLDKNLRRVAFINPSSFNSWGMTFDLRFHFGMMKGQGSSIVVKPYFSWVFKGFDVSETDDNINGEGASSSYDSSQNLSHIGVKFILNYSVFQ